MKKVVKKIALLLIVFGIGVGVTLLYTNNKYKVYEEEETKQIKKHVDTISMMLETEAGSGNYEMTTRSEWPTEGYVFNATLSKCENGGELSWDDTNKRVVMSGNVSDKCYVYFDKYNPITINNYSITSNGNSITITIDATAGTGTIAKYLYSKDNGVSYVQSANNTYTFTGLDKGTYNIKAYVQDSNGKNSEIISKTIEITSIILADYVKSLYTGTQGENNIYYHTSTLTNGAGDNSYRYAGASENVNNYVCFGSTESPCPTDNLYRIIGVFNGKVKLVKYNDIGTFDTSKFDATSFADTEAYNALNSTFIDTFDIRWKNMISTENWISGIVSSSSVSKLNFKNNNTNVKFLAGSATSPLTINWYTAKNWYIVESGAEHKLSMKIGTISISELRYAMNSSNWNLSTLDNTSWLYYNKNEAFYLFECFTDNVANDAYGYYMTTDGILYAYYSPTKISLLEDITTYVRPSFYLTSSVLYKSGIGSSSDAIYITD